MIDPHETLKMDVARRIADLALSSGSNAEGAARMATLNRVAEALFVHETERASWREAALTAYSGATFLLQTQIELTDLAIQSVQERGRG